MNGSGFVQKKFRLDEEKIFLPNEDSSSEEIWLSIYKNLKQMNNDGIIYTNIGFQMWASVVMVANSVQSIFFEDIDVANFFKSEYSSQLQILRRLNDYGKICFIEDPNFFGLLADSKLETKIRRQNFHIYANYMRNLANQLGADYLSPCARASNYVISNNFSEGFNSIIGSDGVHGTEAYYEKVASIIVEHSTAHN